MHKILPFSAYQLPLIGWYVNQRNQTVSIGYTFCLIAGIGKVIYTKLFPGLALGHHVGAAV
jgi:hypothetical protein